MKFMGLFLAMTFAFQASANLSEAVRPSNTPVTLASGKVPQKSRQSKTDAERGIYKIEIVSASASQEEKHLKHLTSTYTMSVLTGLDKYGKPRIRVQLAQGALQSYYPVFDSASLLDNSGNEFPQNLRDLYLLRNQMKSATSKCPLEIRVNEKAAKILSIRPSSKCRRFS